MIQLLIDENVSGAIVRGLRRRVREADLLRVQDVGLLGADDPVILAWAADHRCVVLSHDRRTMAHFANERIRAGLSMPGVLLLPSDLSIGQAIEDLELILRCSVSSDWDRLATYLPL